MKRALLIALLTGSATCRAGGTLETADLMPLLEQKPAIKEFIFKNFDVSEGAYAEVRLGGEFGNLGGGRLGPYTIQIRPKGIAEPSQVVLTLCTTYDFLDRRGRPIKSLNRAARVAADVKETLVGVKLMEAAAKQPLCP